MQSNQNAAGSGPVVCPPCSQPPQFFSDHRRGEVSELRQLLRTIQTERTDVQRQRDTIKKVIAFMTLGIDVSRLFSEMILACCTTDIVQKKMIYLYLTTYGETNPELALLAVNTLTKDCHDHDPTIRGLALRSLCSLRAPTMLEYLEPAVRRGLSDRSGYVRRTAVIGVLKLWNLNPALTEGSGRKVDINSETEVNKALNFRPKCDTESMTDILFAMLNDVDPQVVINAVSVLNEILSNEGGLAFTKKLMISLLNRIKQFNEWGQCTILSLLIHYIPETDDELFDIFNLLEDRLKHSSSTVVLSAVKCFIELTNKKELQEPIFLRLKSPMLTLVATAAPEIAYVVLSHLHKLLLLFDDAQTIDDPDQSIVIKVMSGDYKLFFCNYSDTSYIKLVKLEILSMIVTQTTAFSILSELSEYVMTDVDATIVKKSIEVMGKIGFKFPNLSENILDQLLMFVDLGVETLSAPGFSVIRNFLRKYPQLFSLVKETLIRLFPKLVEPESIAAAFWIIGQFGDEIEEAPYLLENFIEELFGESSSKTENEKKPHVSSFFSSKDSVLLELLTACLKIFITRSPEIQGSLGKLFQTILADDAVDFDVRDRTLHFYRFLLEAKTMGSQKTIQLLKTIIIDPPVSDGLVEFFEEIEPKLLSKNSSDFNTLSLLFQHPTEKCFSSQLSVNFNGRFLPSETAVKKQLEQVEMRESQNHVKSSAKDMTDLDDYIQTSDSISGEDFEVLWEQLPINIHKQYHIKLPSSYGENNGTPLSDYFITLLKNLFKTSYCVVSSSIVTMSNGL